MKKIIISIILLLINAIAFNQTIVEKTIDVKSQKSVRLDFDFADEIKISGWDKNEIYVKASVSINDNVNNDAFSLEVIENSSSISFISDIENMKEISKNRITIHKKDNGDRSITYNDGWHIDMDIYFEVFLPKNMKIDVQSISGDVILKNTLGELNIGTISGCIDIEIDENAKVSVETSTISGGVYTDHNIQINRNDSDRKYHFVMGRSPDFDLNGGGRSIDLETISGDIFIRK